MLVFHSDGRAVINSVAAILDGVTYPLAAVASIETRANVPGWSFLDFFCAFFGALATLAGVVVAGQAIVEAGGGPLPFSHIGPAVFILACGVMLLCNAWLWADRRPRYALILSTSAGERVALVDFDPAYVEGLRLALERAFVASAGMMSAPGGRTPQ